HAYQHAAEVGAVVAVVEEADVPVAAHPFQEPQESAWPLGEFEAVDELVARERGVAADHVADVELGHLVVGEIERAKAVALQRADYARGLVAALHADAGEDVRLLGVGDAVVELGDVARTDDGAELAEASGALGDGDGED